MLRTESHQIKGTAGAMGYPMMTEQAGRLEQCLRQSEYDWPEIAQRLEQLNHMIDQALKALVSTTGTRQEQTHE